MLAEHMSLASQMEMVFRSLKDELANLASGTIFVQIRNNLIGKFGVKHFPLAVRENSTSHRGLSEHHLQTLSHMGLMTLEQKRWTHGELLFEFEIMNEDLRANILCESNYNMNHLIST